MILDYFFRLIFQVIGPVGLRRFLTVTLGLSRSPLAFKLDVTEIEPLDWQYPEDWSNWEVEQELTGNWDQFNTERGRSSFTL